jgi:hypothetical protein
MHRPAQLLVGGLVVLGIAGVGVFWLQEDPVPEPAVAVRAATARIAVLDGLDRDGERLVQLLSEAGDVTWAEDDAIAYGLVHLDPQARSGRPSLSFGEARQGDQAPQYILVDSKPVLGVLAECVARQIWCVVQRKDSEDKALIWKRSELYLQQWDEQLPTDAQWASWVGRAIPGGVEAAWLAVVDGELKLARPSGGDTVGLADWPGMKAADFVCLAEQRWEHKDPAFPCGSPVEPCSGPSLPAAVVRWVHPRIRELELDWGRTQLRAVHVTLEGELSEATARTELGLPPPGQPLPANLLSVVVQPRGGKTRLSLRASTQQAEQACP